MKTREELKAKHARLPFVDEGRKRVILIAAAILAASKLAQYDDGKRVLLLSARSRIRFAGPRKF
jgi:hypothetical protein